MELIDFDGAFQQYVSGWIKENSARFGGDMDLMEQEMPGLYLAWIETPADFLDGKAPISYFAEHEDAWALVDWMCRYLEAGVPLPDLLLERLVEVGQPAEQPLLMLLDNPDAGAEAILHTIGLLTQLESTLPMAQYIQRVAGAERADEEIAERAAEALYAMGEEAVPAMLAALPEAAEAGQDLLLDVLSHYPGEESVYQLALERFETRPEQRALFAGYLGRLGDDRAVPALLRVAENPQTNYLDFIEISAAIEQLGGEAPAAREFEDDPYYESLKQVDE